MASHQLTRTGDVVDWWFWWHSVELERYALWYPYNYFYPYTSYSKPIKGGGKAPRIFNDVLSHPDRWLGSTHTVKEFIGPQPMTIRIEFKDSSHFCLSWEELQKAGYESAVCAVLWDAKLPMKVGEFVHLWRRKEGGDVEGRYVLAKAVVLAVQDHRDGVLGIQLLDCGNA